VRVAFVVKETRRRYFHPRSCYQSLKTHQTRSIPHLKYGKYLEAAKHRLKVCSDWGWMIDGRSNCSRTGSGNCWLEAARYEQTDCTSQNAVGRGELPSSGWDRLCAKENRQRERKEVDVCPFDLRKSRWNPTEGGNRDFIDKRFWSSAEFEVAATVRLPSTPCIITRILAGRLASAPCSAPSDRVVVPPHLVCPSLQTLQERLFYSEPTCRTMPTTPDVSRQLTAGPPSTCSHDWKRRTFDHA
jgi:hypothetical protein